MFDNIGKKIKSLAKVVTVLGVIASAAFGLVFMAHNQGEPEIAFLGVLIGIVGCLLSWALSYLLYGFGELINNSARIADCLSKDNCDAKEVK